MKKVFLIVLVVFVNVSSVFSQVLLGEVSDQNGKPIEDAIVYILANDVHILGGETNAQGRFKWSSGATGKYEITISRIGYEEVKKQIYFNSLNDTVNVEFIMVSREELPVVEISYVKPQRTTSGVTVLDQKDFNVLPGSYNDPTRLMIKTPEVSTTNDQANSIVYRGLPDRFINWSLNGAQIINPNHLSNAGTSLDFASPVAGGVNAIGGQTIDQFIFSGGVGNNLFNTISGTADIRTDGIERYGQFSLLGLEAGYNWKDFSVGYRYSFTGLLANLGVDFGGEKIGFQDLNLRYKKVWKGHKLIVSGTIGDSYNDFEPLENPEIEKERRSISYDSKLWIGGINYQYHNFELYGAWSGRTDGRFAENALTKYKSRADFNDQKLALSGTYNFYNDLKAGVHLLKDINNYKLISPEKNNDLVSDTFDFKDNFYTFSPYLDFQKDISLFNFHTRLKPTYYSYYEDVSLDFDLNVIFNLNRFGTLTAGVGHFSQGSDDYAALYYNLTKPVKSWVYELRHFVQLNQAFRLETSLFNYNVYDLAITDDGYHSFNSLDVNLFDQNMVVNQNGKGRSYGASFDVEFSSNGFNINVNATLFTSEVLQNKRWLSSSYDYGFMSNVMAGKVWSFSENTKFLRVGCSFHIRGGAFQYPILLKEDNLYNQSIFTNGPTEVLSNYMRSDFKITYQFTKWEVSLDVQNITNQLNDGYFFKEPGETNLRIQPQLGLIPVLTIKYKIM